MLRLDATLASGVFKFSQAQNQEGLAHFAQTYWKNDPNFLELSVRGCDGERKFGIDFRFRHSGKKEDYERFLDQCIGKLRRTFGKSFVGWDVCSSTLLVK